MHGGQLRRDERDACGIGFVARSDGTASRDIVDSALEALCRVRHRGAVAADALTGDGAGLLVPIPAAVLEGAAGRSADGDLGVMMVFFDPAAPSPGRAAVESACAAEGVKVVGWRQVPVEESALGDGARATMPVIEQALIAVPNEPDPTARELRAFRARRRIERTARDEELNLYVASSSFRTVVYKALCAADQLGTFYPDLVDERFQAWFAIFHQRYSTNTAPTWDRAQPFRFVGHNGEINTIRGNVALMEAREADLATTPLGSDGLLSPVISPGNSDSGAFDEALEILVRGGRSLAHSAAMLVPPAWEASTEMSPDVRDFFAYHSCLIEPWDGPAAIVYGDGTVVGASLDRNGLRPMRISVCEDGMIACASEAGAVATEGRGSVRRTKLGPGRTVVVDPARGGLVEDASVRDALATKRPYGAWASSAVRKAARGEPVTEVAAPTTPRQIAAGFSKEEMTVVLRPMATEGVEPTSSMGDDTAQPPLASYGRPIFNFLKQRFAQVTNPPIDHLRERHVMSLTTRLGRRAPLLDEAALDAQLREYAGCFVFPSAVDDLVDEGAEVLDATFPVADGATGLEAACIRLGDEAEAVLRAGAEVIVVSDRAAGESRVGIPSALAAGAVHHRLLGAGLRSRAGLVVDCNDVRETHHAACLVTNGADMVCPRLALESIAELSARGRLGGSVDAATAQENFLRTMEDGLLKVMSKMGIATLDSYRSAQIIEAIGLGHDVIATCFTGVASPLGGLSFEQLGRDLLERHTVGYAPKATLASTGFIKHKAGGEYHAINPDVVDALHDAVELEAAKEALASEEAAAHQLRAAVKGNDEAYARFSRLVDDRPPTEPRDLLELAPGQPVPIEEVEPVDAIVKRFSTGAMSHGALSAEAHETLSIALNMIGGRANTGEGGEDPARYADERNSSIKQVASGRFGVTPDYLANAQEIQIKMAQGSKPGEGGQLPGNKVTVEIARLRHTVPGIALISPPPHHDIYSIEDLAQLIFDLKQANPAAAVSVKLVSSEGVGTIAAGVVKALADVVHIAGGDGGTGASPLSSIKNAGLPWEIGLADTQATLVDNGLRGRVRLRIDGGIKNGRDIVLAALLGADEYSFGTAALVAEGCILVRTCHRNTCPVGIATQDEKLRAKYAGTPEMVARYLLYVAEEVRGLVAGLGLRRLEDAVGRTDLLRRIVTGNDRADSLDLSPLLLPPRGEHRFTGPLDLQKPRSELGDRLHDDALAALESADAALLSYDITNADRAVGAKLGCALRAGGSLAGGRVEASFTGAAGQSFGAFLSDGIDLTLHGEANDYVGKGMGGGRVVIKPPGDDAGDPSLVGNTVLYGATGGQLFVAGRAGERFAVRNSGAVAVVEGVGDHACEYMTSGAVVVLGATGINLGAGMSGGEAYVYDPHGDLDARINPQLVGIYAPTEAQQASLKRVIQRHHDLTGSQRARRLLEEWDSSVAKIRRVAPKAEVARLEALFEGTASAAA